MVQVTRRWHVLVAEAQFAAELTLVGLRRLCLVPSNVDLERWVGDDQNYALHVGMHSYSSGLERLCKLAIACHAFATVGTFPRLREFSHNIGGLLDAVEVLDLGRIDPSRSTARYVTRPVDALDPDLTNAVERYANGPGRYEHLDSLWNSQTEVSMYREWVSLCGRSGVSEDVRELIWIRSAVAEAVTAELVQGGLESCAQPVFDDLDRHMFEPSVGVALSLFRKARWVSSIIDEATHYTHQDLPILGEAVASVFRCSSRDFFAYEIARFSDVDVVVEELEEALPRIRERQRAEDEAEESGDLWS